jgi:hypothetical protein
MKYGYPPDPPRNRGDSSRFPFDVFAFGRQNQCAGCVAVVETSDRAVVEQALRIRDGVGEDPWQVREAGADHNERQILLTGLMAGLADRGKVAVVEVLHLVDEQGDTGVDATSVLGKVEDQIGEICVQ